MFSQVDQVLPKHGSRDNEINKNKKQIVNLDFSEKPGSGEYGNNYGALKGLIKKLDKMCNILSATSPLTSNIPIFGQGESKFALYLVLSKTDPEIGILQATSK